MTLRPLLRSAVLSSISLVLLACGRDAPPAAVLAPPVRVVDVGAAAASQRISATGLVRAAVEAPLAFKTGGIVAEVRVVAGQAVKAGQPLALLATSDLDAALAQAREGLAKNERDLARAESLRSKGMISQQGEQDVRAQRDVARAALAAAEFNRQQAAIAAPADGVILEKRVEARETVAAGQPVVIFGQLDRGWVVRAGVSARDALKLKVGDRAEVILDGDGSRLEAAISRMAATSDPRTGTIEIELALPKSEVRVLSGMVARLLIATAERSDATLMTVPLSSVIEGNAGKAKLFVLDGADKVKRIEVHTGRIVDGRIEVLDGLNANAKVVSEGAAWLDDGVTVRILP